MKLFFVLIVLCPFLLIAEVSPGIRLQKTHQLYWENGVTLDYTHDRLLDRQVHVGLTFISSRIGAAWNSNALKQDHYMIYGAWVFRRNRLLQPAVRVNTGYFFADYEAKLFDDLTNTSMLLSAETGFIINAYESLGISLMLGYNFITGNGRRGAGTLFPLFYHFSISWTLKGGV